MTAGLNLPEQVCKNIYHGLKKYTVNIMRDIQNNNLKL